MKELQREGDETMVVNRRKLETGRTGREVLSKGWGRVTELYVTDYSVQEDGRVRTNIVKYLSDSAW